MIKVAGDGCGGVWMVKLQEVGEGTIKLEEMESLISQNIPRKLKVENTLR